MKSRVVDRGQVHRDHDFEYGFNIQFAICEETVGSEQMVMGYTVMPPGTRNQGHIHTNVEVMWFLLKGHTIHWSDSLERDSYKETECFDGTCGYVYPGEIHVGMNLSETETGENLFVYAGVNDKDKAGTVWIDDFDVVDEYRAAHGQKPLPK